MTHWQLTYVDSSIFSLEQTGCVPQGNYDCHIWWNFQMAVKFKKLYVSVYFSCRPKTFYIYFHAFSMLVTASSSCTSQPLPPIFTAFTALMQPLEVLSWLMLSPLWTWIDLLHLLSHAYIAWLHECHVTACSYRLRKLHDSASWRLLETGFLCTVKYLCIVQAKPVLLRFICYIAPSVEG